MSLTVPKEQLLKKNGGLVEFEYDHSEYWPALINLAETRRQEAQQRWEKGGKRIGEHERYLQGGAEPSLVEVETVNKTDANSETEDVRPEQS